MKIGILTQPLNINYGGLLQNYALQQILKKEGHMVITIDWINKEFPLTFRQKLSKFKHTIFNSPFHKKYLINESFGLFKDNNINSTRIVSNNSDFLIFAKEYGIEAFVVGSDQCWRPKYSYPYIEEMFLSFAKDMKNVKRIAYAASFGTDKWEFSEEETQQCSKLVSFFDCVTVRESSGIDLCKRYLGVNANLVLDPTLLLLKQDYISLLLTEDIPSSPGSLYYYVLDNNTEITKFIGHVANDTGYTPFCVSMVNKNVRDNPGIVLRPSVYSWIKGFLDAKMIIVDSFHGMVFSVIFNKPFWVIGNKARGMSRFESLLELLGLEDRLLHMNSCYNVDFNKKIDWDSVNSKLDILRIKSMNLLLKHLNNE